MSTAAFGELVARRAAAGLAPLVGAARAPRYLDRTTGGCTAGPLLGLLVDRIDYGVGMRVVQRPVAKGGVPGGTFCVSRVYLKPGSLTGSVYLTKEGSSEDFAVAARDAYGREWRVATDAMGL